MIKYITPLLSILLALAWSTFAQAEIYKHVDADGNVTYSNVKIKGAKKLDLEPADTNFGNTGASSSNADKRQSTTRTATPASFPKVDAGTQNQRDNKRKEILQAELDNEKKALESAKKALNEGASNPEVYKTADGKTMRNVAKYDEKIKTLQAEVDVHQRNVELLEKEMGNIN